MFLLYITRENYIIGLSVFFDIRNFFLNNSDCFQHFAVAVAKG
jgi:hypothetical protein